GPKLPAVRIGLALRIRALSQITAAGSEGFEILLLAGGHCENSTLRKKKCVEKKLSPLPFSMGHNCLWRSHAYSLGLTSSQVSVSHRGPFFCSGSLFVSCRNNRAASEIKSAGGLFEAQETVSWLIKKYSTISSSRIVSLSPVRATSRCGSATRITRWGRSCCTSV